MKRMVFSWTVALASLLGPVYAKASDDKVVEISRDQAAIGEVKTIALLPIIVQLRFDQTKDVPDPTRVAARFAVADRLAEILDQKMRAAKRPTMPVEAAILAIKARSWTSIDTCITTATGTWNSPAETVRNRGKDEVTLLALRSAMRQSPESVTAFAFSWHGLPGSRQGIAAFHAGVDSKPDIPKLKELNNKLHADAMLFCEVSDLDEKDLGLTYRTTVPLIYGIEEVKGTRVHIHCLLIRAQDGAILWEARSTGTSSGNVADRAINVSRQAMEGAGRAVDGLVSDLIEGTGVPPKK
ncbi:MAG TPA: hypothetical protein VKT77_03535 [Chthonomonadaceae bacterium]|nr:hypothetical protein [Chthonomonadaceae bacterium]